MSPLPTGQSNYDMQRSPPCQYTSMLGSKGTCRLFHLLAVPLGFASFVDIARLENTLRYVLKDHSHIVPEASVPQMQCRQ